MITVTTLRKKPLGMHVLALAFALALCAPLSALAATKEAAVKAGFIYNFTKYITWPTGLQPQANFNLCVEGNDRLDGALEALYGKLVDGRPLILNRNVSGGVLQACNMVYIADDVTLDMEKTLQKFKGLPVVTVSDKADFIEKGGMLGLVRDNKRVAFEVNLKPAKAVGLTISAQLLKHAKRVKGL